MSVDAAAADRLPWLADEPAPRQLGQRRGGLLPWVAAAIAVVAAAAWLGARSVQESSLPSAGQSSTTVELPPLHPPAASVQRSPAQPQFGATPEPEDRASPVSEVPLAARSAPARRVSSASKKSPPAKRAAAVSSHVVTPKRRNPPVANRARRALVQIGAFGSVHQAERGWRVMAHDYPAMSDLPAVVRQARNSKGRTFYRFYVGTTSQAHSEALCKHIVKIGLSCAVVASPSKKVER